MRFIIILLLALGSAAWTQPDPKLTPGWDGLRPYGKLTPGAVDPRCDVKQVCAKGYSAAARDVSESEKKEVFKRYGISWSQHASYEVDHAVSIEICGSNDVTNLWPQPYAGVAYTARMKDQVEDFLHREVCLGHVPLADAQKQILNDWMVVYGKCCKGKAAAGSTRPALRPVDSDSGK